MTPRSDPWKTDTMNPRRLELPNELDFVPRDDVIGLIESADRDLAQLEKCATALRAEARQVEDAAKRSGVDPDSSSWALVRLQFFLDQLREESRREAAAAVEVAHRRAAVLLEGVPVFAPVALDSRGPSITTRGDESAAVSEGSRPEDGTRLVGDWLADAERRSPEPPPSDVVHTFSRPTPEALGDAVLDPTGDQPVARADERDIGADPTVSGALVASASATISAQSTGNGSAPVPVATTGTQLTPNGTLRDAPAIPDSRQDVSELFWVALGAGAAGAHRTPDPEVDDAKSAAPSRRKRKQPESATATKPPKPPRARKIPVSAILEILAVLLILIFILLRLG